MPPCSPACSLRGLFDRIASILLTPSKVSRAGYIRPYHTSCGQRVVTIPMCHLYVPSLPICFFRMTTVQTIGYPFFSLPILEEFIRSYTSGQEQILETMESINILSTSPLVHINKLVLQCNALTQQDSEERCSLIMIQSRGAVIDTLFFVCCVLSYMYITSNSYKVQIHITPSHDMYGKCHVIILLIAWLYV